MKKRIQRLIGIALIMAMLVSGNGFGISQAENAYANETTSPYISTISGGMLPKVTYFSAENETNTFTLWVPDTASPGLKYFPDTCKYNNETLYYQVKANQLNGNADKNSEKLYQIIEINGLSYLPIVGVKLANQFPVGSTVTKTLIVGPYDTSTMNFKEDLAQEYTVTFNRKVMLTAISASDSLGNSLTLNAALDQYKGGTYAIKVSEDAETITLNCTPKTSLAQYDADGNLTTAGTIISYGAAETARTDGTNTFDISKLPVNSDGKKYIPIQLEYRISSEENTQGIVPANVQGTEYTVLVETGNYIPAVNTENEDSYEYDRAAEDVVPLSVTVDIAEEAKGTLTYQWYGRTHTNFVKIDGAASSEYTPSTDHVWKTDYLCRVTNTVSGAAYSADSKIITVNVLPTSASLPEITKQPENATCLTGENAELSVTASSPDNWSILTYQWYKSENADGSNSVIIDGETNASIEVYAKELGKSYYYCQVTNTVGHTTDDEGNPVGGYTAVQQTSVAEVNVTKIPGIEYFEKEGADGSEQYPYKINNLEDLMTMKNLVEKGYGLEGIYFQLTADLELSKEWDPIGSLIDPSKGDEWMGANVYPFMGIFDGAGHKVTIAEDGLPLFRYVRKATIKNLNIYGTKIASSALISGFFADYGTSGEYETVIDHTVTIDNCRLLSGSKTKEAGFLKGSGSGANDVYILNSTIEENVVIGYDGTIKGGSFIEILNGKITNCTSYATVNGVGGIAGRKGQSMGACSIVNCAFLGTVNSNTYAGGIIGSGYNGYASTGNSAPNTPVVSVKNCYVVGDISGEGSVGGIIGTEPSCECCWSNGRGTISNNYFYGTLTGTTEDTFIGGIAGFLKSYNKYQGFDNNYYLITNGNADGIGSIETIITKDHEKYGATFGLEGEFVENEVCIPTTSAQVSSGELAADLNAGNYSSKNWTQGEEGYPILSKTPVPYELELSGEYKTSYNVGDKFSNENMIITAIYTDGTKKELTEEELKLVVFSGYSSTIGEKEINVRYGAAETSYSVTVLYSEPKAITVSFQLYGDSRHDSDADGKVHTLRSGNLESWLYVPSVEIDQNTTVWDVIQRVLKANNMTCSNPSGNYIESITRNGVTLAEFDNGNLSGWMYTLNGSHPSLGVSEQYLNNGDRIVFHYTDDYTKEEGSDHWGNVPYVPEETLPEDAPTVTVTDEAGAAATEGGKVTYDSESKTLTITANDGYEIKDVKVNGVSKGAVTSLTGLTKDDKVEVIFAKSAVTELTAEDLDALLADLTPVARSVKTPNKNVKVTVNLDETDKAIIDRIEDTGYTVKYNFYRSTKKSSKYKSMLIKSGKSYTNTKGKKDRMYFYKARVQVYDADGKLIARTALKQCKYANRKWTKK